METLYIFVGKIHQSTVDTPHNCYCQDYVLYPYEYLMPVFVSWTHILK